MSLRMMVRSVVDMLLGMTVGCVEDVSLGMIDMKVCSVVDNVSLVSEQLVLDSSRVRLEGQVQTNF